MPMVPDAARPCWHTRHRRPHLFIPWLKSPRADDSGMWGTALSGVPTSSQPTLSCAWNQTLDTEWLKSPRALWTRSCCKTACGTRVPFHYWRELAATAFLCSAGPCLAGSCVCPPLCKAQSRKSVKCHLSVPVITTASTEHSLLSMFTNINETPPFLLAQKASWSSLQPRALWEL